MKRVLIGTLAAGAIALLAGVALAHGPGSGWGHMGSGMMGGGRGHMGPGVRGGDAAGQAGCPGWSATSPSETPVTQEKAKDLAQQYADTYLKGFMVDKVLPFTGMHGTMYSIELKGPEDEVRTFHVNPRGVVMPFGGPWRSAG